MESVAIAALNIGAIIHVCFDARRALALRPAWLEGRHGCMLLFVLICSVLPQACFKAAKGALRAQSAITTEVPPQQKSPDTATTVPGQSSPSRWPQASNGRRRKEGQASPSRRPRLLPGPFAWTSPASPIPRATVCAWCCRPSSRHTQFIQCECDVQAALHRSLERQRHYATDHHRDGTIFRTPQSARCSGAFEPCRRRAQPVTRVENSEPSVGSSLRAIVCSAYGRLEAGL